jgi:hypothetical protein
MIYDVLHFSTRFSFRTFADGAVEFCCVSPMGLMRFIVALFGSAAP